MKISSKASFALIIAVTLAIQAAFSEVATFNVQLVQNKAPGPTLFSCRISLENGSVAILGSGFSKPIQQMIWAGEYVKIPKFKDHLCEIKDDPLARNLLAIAKRFELCRQGTELRIVDGGMITEVACSVNPAEPAQKADYIAMDQSNRRANQMEEICRDLQMLVVSDVLNENGTKEKALGNLKLRSEKLAANIESYSHAISLLDDAYKKDSLPDWTKITDLIRFRPNQLGLENRTRLVRTAHDVLTASCSHRGLPYILGRGDSNSSAMIVKIGEVRRCRGSFSIPEDPDWGFDDIQTSLGFAYPPHDPATRVGILDLGLERLLLHFILQEDSNAPTAYDRFSLAISGRDWRIIERWKLKNKSMPNDVGKRLQYLSGKSGLLEHLLNGEVPDEVVFLDLKAIVIEDDKWNNARLDYRLGNDERVLPLVLSDGTWVPNQPWTDRAYRDVGEYIENSDFFRSRAEIEKHNAEPSGAGQSPDSKSNGDGKPRPESETIPR